MILLRMFYTTLKCIFFVLIIYYHYRPTKKRKAGDADDFDETPKKKVKRALPDNVDKCKAAIERVDVSINKWIIKKTEKVIYLYLFSFIYFYPFKY